MHNQRAARQTRGRDADRERSGRPAVDRDVSDIRVGRSAAVGDQTSLSRGLSLNRYVVGGARRNGLRKSEAPVCRQRQSVECAVIRQHNRSSGKPRQCSADGVGRRRARYSHVRDVRVGNNAAPIGNRASLSSRSSRDRDRISASRGKEPVERECTVRRNIQAVERAVIRKRDRSAVRQSAQSSTDAVERSARHSHIGDICIRCTSPIRDRAILIGRLGQYCYSVLAAGGDRGCEGEWRIRRERERVRRVVRNHHGLACGQPGERSTDRIGREHRGAGDADINDIRVGRASAVGDRASLSRWLRQDRHCVCCARSKRSGEGECSVRTQRQIVAAVVLQHDRPARQTTERSANGEAGSPASHADAGDICVGRATATRHRACLSGRLRRDRDAVSTARIDCRLECEGAIGCKAEAVGGVIR